MRLMGFIAIFFFFLDEKKCYRGYLAPEYASSGQVSRKSDVYSFGVLLLQIVSGRAVVGAYQDMERFIVEKV